MGIRLSEEPAEDGYRHAFIHPSSVNGALLEIIEVTEGINPWPAAGPDWQSLEHRPLTKQLRQMAVLVRDLDQAVARWEEMFGITATKRFEVSFTDLEIAVLPLSGKDTFIELAQPTGSGVPSARFLERYGEGIYLTIYEIDDSLTMDGLPERARSPLHIFAGDVQLREPGLQQHLAPSRRHERSLHPTVPGAGGRQPLAPCRGYLASGIALLSNWSTGQIDSPGTLW